MNMNKKTEKSKEIRGKILSNDKYLEEIINKGLSNNCDKEVNELCCLFYLINEFSSQSYFNFSNDGKSDIHYFVNYNKKVYELGISFDNGFNPYIKVADENVEQVISFAKIKEKYILERNKKISKCLNSITYELGILNELGINQSIDELIRMRK